jgi:hypothetical protein
VADHLGDRFEGRAVLTIAWNGAQREDEQIMA